jgi:hypothetical protein
MAFGQGETTDPFSWGDAPGYDEFGLRPCGKRPIHFPGAMPQATMNLAFGQGETTDPFSWGDAPGYDEFGLRPCGNDGFIFLGRCPGLR